MTTLKSQYADEIAKAMADILGNEEFSKLYRTAALKKEASDVFTQFLSKFEQYKGNPGPGGRENVRDKAEDDLESIKIQLESGEYEKGIGLIRDWYTSDVGIEIVPKGNLADDKEQDCAITEPADDGQVAIAVDFAMGHLIKIADVLDKKGFADVAGLLDETLNKLASKKNK